MSTIEPKPAPIAAQLHGAAAARTRTLADRMRARLERAFAGFPWEVQLVDPLGRESRFGGDAAHWCGRPLQIRVHTDTAAQRLAAWDAMGFLESVLAGEADLDGNLYLLSHVRRHTRFDLRWRDVPGFLWRHRAFQNPARARESVRSHYDVPQEAIDLYLDRRYRAYSCAIFEDPAKLSVEALLRAGTGEPDEFDTLEKAQWRKFQNAVDYVAPDAGETLLDVGCGYAGQLEVALERHPFGRVVGWTHSQNQVREGRQAMARFDPSRWEIHDGDYRSDDSVYDHVTSTGMVSHVGPRGLAPYVRQVRRRIRSGGRYLHHALMRVPSSRPFELQIGTAFHKRYVWPGYHWFTVGEHVRALERGGFEIQAMVNLTQHYAKTGSAWYERMVAEGERVRAALGDPTYRAWRIFLGGASGDMAEGGIHVFRIFCRAV